MSTKTVQTTVNLNDFCDASHTLEGTAPATEFGALDDYVGGSLEAVAWSLAGSSKAVRGAQYDKDTEPVHRFLHVKASTQVTLTCGRCLNPMKAALTVDNRLQVFQTDDAADAAAMIEDADVAPDPIVSSRQFDLIDQVQEELLLNLPDNPTHEDGDAACVLPVTIDNQIVSPFAELARLKKA